MNRTLHISRWAAGGTALALLSACAVMPDGPSVTALPGSGKTFDQFRADDMNCRGYATQQIGGASASQAATDSAVGTVALTTAVGALAGLALGGHGSGAAVGAGAGLLTGAVIGSGTAQSSGESVQRRYDSAYTQCMYAAGERVPVSGRMASGYQGAPQQGYYPQQAPQGYPQQGYYPQQGGYAPPPPPPGYQGY